MAHGIRLGTMCTVTSVAGGIKSKHKSTPVSKGLAKSVCEKVTSGQQLTQHIVQNRPNPIDTSVKNEMQLFFAPTN